MKKFTLTLASLLFVLVLNAQEIWLETALKGGAGMSFLMNKNILNDNSYRQVLSPMYGFGGKVAVNFGAWHGIALEGLFNSSSQKWDYTLPNVTGDLQNEVKWNSVELYLLYRYIRSRTYIEVGPMFSMIRSVEQTDNEVQLQNPDPFYEDNYLAAVFGFGGYLGGSETFSVGLGLRVHYGFQDLVSAEGRASGFPNPVRESVYSSEASTNPLVAQLLVEFNFGIGHWAKTSCHERMKFFRN